jgi:O-antigen/teichoic acid export membrane protein
MTESIKALLSGRQLARNAGWNFGGLASPLLVALFTIPLLIEEFGTERFGLLAIVWMGVGYFSLFDMGFGRALTKLVAERLGSRQFNDLGSLIWTALSLIFTFGVAGAMMVVLCANPLVVHILNVEMQLHRESIVALQILAIGLPIVVTTTALIGLLEAHQRFTTIMAVRVPLGMMTFAAPLLTSLFSPSLVWATGALVLARLLAFSAYYFVAASVRPELKHPELPQIKHFYPLMQFGGWLTVTNIIGPLMVYFDLFFIGAVMTLTAVTYYVTPYEVLFRTQLLPRSIMTVMFPALTTAMTADRKRMITIYSQGARILPSLMLPIMGAFFLIAPEGLEIWLGDDFRRMATPVVQWLACGLVVNTLARMPFTVLQSAGRPDLVAKIHLLELFPYLCLLWILTKQFGISGAAAAWFLRALADALILNWLVRIKMPELSNIVARTMGWLCVILAGFGLGSLIESILARGLLLIVLMAASAASLWFFLKPFWQTRLSAAEKVADADTK